MERNPSEFLALELPDALRAAANDLARFIQGVGSDLAFVENATAGCNTVLASMQFSPGDEILVRMSIAGMSVNHGLLESMAVGDRSCNCDRFAKLTIGHRPISTDLPSASTAESASSLVHGRWNAVT